MVSDITKEYREFFENYLKEHPVKQGDDLNSEVYDDDRMNYDHEAACLRLAKMFLEGKIK